MPIKQKRIRRKRKKGHYHTGVFVSKKTGQHCKYRSGWELLFLQHLDTSSDVRAFCYEGLKIPYISNTRSRRIRNYIPDIFVEYVDGRTSLIEIKPSRKLAQPTVQKKLAAAREWCGAHGAALEIITEHELKSMGLL